MKIAISGKGGVGKTTLAALLAQTYADRGRAVLAVDSDPSPSLARALAFPDELLQELRPISEMDELIEERTGAPPGSMGGFFTLNPRVDDVPERFSAVHDGVRLLEMGSVDSGGSGCICPESAMLKTLVTYTILYRDEVMILDMEAGVEHLGRATAGAVDAFLIVVEPGRRSLGTARTIQSLAADIGISRCYVVGNKVRDEADRDFVRDSLPSLDVIGFLSADPRAVEADRRGEAIFDAVPELVDEARHIAAAFDEAIAG